ncbi:MAG: helix-hairpin-helix domain-containing protein [Lentisphaeraceae bacterium]|nr:helix-hairpin-helix domain-containing protein [Lentisphaeraceae bacterium]
MKPFLLLSLFSLSVFAEYPFTPKKEEIHRKGFYIIESSKLPNDYQYLWSKAKFNIYKKIHFSNKIDKSYRDTVNTFNWKVFTHDSYLPDIPAGILLLSSSFSFNAFPTAFKELCKEFNLILVSPDLSKERQHRKYTLELSLSALDLIKQRYEINNNRVFYVAFGNKVKHEAHLHSPQLFNGIFSIRSQVGWDEKELSKILGKTDYKKFISTLKKKPFYLLEPKPTATDVGFENGRIIYEDNYFHPSLKNNTILYTKDLFLTEKSHYSSLSVNHINKELFSELRLSVLSRAFKFLDSNSLKLKEKYFDEGVKFEQNEQYPQAFKSYQNAYKLSHPKAKSRIEDLLKEIKKTEFTAIKNFAQKNYYDAFKTARFLKNNYPAKYVKDSNIILTKIKADEKIITEIKAAIYLNNVKNSLNQSPVPVDDIIAACEKVIKTVPGTVTAEKAQKIIDSLK